MLPSTASAENKLSRRVRYLLLLAACAALSAPTVYLLRAPQVRADEPTPATSPTPVDVPMPIRAAAVKLITNSFPLLYRSDSVAIYRVP